jgi:hypothetical protein
VRIPKKKRKSEMEKKKINIVSINANLLRTMKLGIDANKTLETNAFP